jgi:hypothetical protein
MTWKSLINTGPDYEEEGYVEWLEQVMQEPWVLALEDLVKWEGVWAGTEEQLIQELRRRVGKEIKESEDFPSTFERVLEYQDYAGDGFLLADLGVYDYRELSEEDLDDFDVPGWGPDAPVLVKAGDAHLRPDFWDVQFKLLKYWHPFPVGILMFTDSKWFPKGRTWCGTTKELSEKLLRHYPTYRNIPWLQLYKARPEGTEDWFPWPGFATDEEMDAMVMRAGSDGFLTFSTMMKKWAPILKEEARIKISWERRRSSPWFPETNDTDEPLRLYWTIEAPRWYKPDLSHIWCSRPDLKGT